MYKVRGEVTITRVYEIDLEVDNLRTTIRELVMSETEALRGMVVDFDMGALVIEEVEE